MNMLKHPITDKDDEDEEGRGGRKGKQKKKCAVKQGQMT